MDWSNIFKIVVVILLLIEGGLAFFRFREKIRKNFFEANIQQDIFKIWHTELNSQISKLRHVGDLVNQNTPKEEILSTLKLTIENLNNTFYGLLLFSSSNPSTIVRALAYFKDRTDIMNQGQITLLKIKLKTLKNFEDRETKRQIEQLLSAIDKEV